MNSATKLQSGAGHGNGSVRTQNQPTCSSPSSVQSSSASSGMMTFSIAPSGLTRAKVAPVLLSSEEQSPRRPRDGGTDDDPRDVVADDAAVQRVEDPHGRCE